MAKKTYTAAANNQNSISIYDVEMGSYVTSIFVTSGQIIGQPVVSADKICVTFTEQGSTYIKIFDGQTFAYLTQTTVG